MRRRASLFFFFFLSGLRPSLFLSLFFPPLPSRPSFSPNADPSRPRARDGEGEGGPGGRARARERAQSGAETTGRETPIPETRTEKEHTRHHAHTAETAPRGKPSGRARNERGGGGRKEEGAVPRPPALATPRARGSTARYLRRYPPADSRPRGEKVSPGGEARASPSPSRPLSLGPRRRRLATPPLLLSALLSGFSPPRGRAPAQRLAPGSGELRERLPESAFRGTKALFLLPRPPPPADRGGGERACEATPAAPPGEGSGGPPAGTAIDRQATLRQA